MNKRQKSRYLFAVYLVVAFIAIILVLIAFQRSSDTWQSFLLNLSTELLVPKKLNPCFFYKDLTF